jgi:hypothetical protein
VLNRFIGSDMSDFHTSIKNRFEKVVNVQKYGAFAKKKKVLNNRQHIIVKLKREFVKFGKKTSKSREFASARGSTGEGPLT